MQSRKLKTANSEKKSVPAYISEFPSKAQTMLRQLRKIIKAAAPQAQESLSYGMPYYSYNGRLAYFAAFKNHCSFFMIPNTLKGFEKKLAKYRTSKSTLQFPIGKPIPIALVKAIVKARLKENELKAKTKKK